MANGSSFPSGVNPLQGFMDDFVAEEAKRDPVLTLQEEFVAEEAARTAAAARWSRTFAPDVYAEAAKLAPHIPEEVAARQIDLVRDKARLEKFSAVFEKAPALRSYFANNPKNLAYANPDELDNLSGIDWLLEAGPAAVRSGSAMIEAAQASNRIAAGQGTIRDRALVDNYKGDRSFGAHGFWDGGFIFAGQQVAPLAGTIVSGLRDALKGSVYAGTAGAVAGSVIPGPGTVAGGFAGAVGGAKVGFTYGALDFQRQLQTGLSRIQLQQIRDSNGNPLEPELVEIAAQVAGLGGAVLEQVADSTLFKRIPGLDKFVKPMTAQGIGEALAANPTYRKALLDFAKNLGITAGTEATTEVLQQGLQIAAEEIAKANSEGSFEYRTGEEVLTELGSAAYQALQTMAVMGPFISGTRFGADVVSINRSKRANDSLRAIAEQADGNLLIERAPGVAAAIIDAQADGRKLYLDSQKFVELYQSTGQDPFGPPLPNWRNRLEGALATNGDVEVSIGEFVAHFGRDPKSNPLLDIVRSDPNDYLPAEIAEYSKGLDEFIQSEVAKATVKAETQAVAAQVENKVRDTLMAELEGAGFSPRVANAYATMLGAYYNAQAQKVGITPEEFLAEPLNQIRVLRESLQATSHTLRNSKDMVGAADELFQDAGFAEWFKDSKIVDETGKPLVLYHGTATNFEAFSKTADAKHIDLPGFFFSPDADIAERFASSASRREFRDDAGYIAGYENAAIMPVYLSLQNPVEIRLDDRQTGTMTGTAEVRAALEAAKAAGHDGAIITGWTDGSGDTQYVAFDPTQIKSVNNRGTFDPNDPNILFQDPGQQPGVIHEPKGSITFDPNGPATIRLFAKADLSTLLHEAGHFFLNNMRDLAARSPAIAADWDLVKKHLGIDPQANGQITRAQHEQFARWMEAYFMEGKAPSAELRTVFQAFRSWLTAVYQSIKALGGRVNPEIAGVFDRMFVVDQRVEDLANDTAYAPLFRDAESMGVSPEEYLEYQKTVEDLRFQAQATARSRIVGQQARLARGWQKEVLAELTNQAVERLKTTPPYSHWETFSKGGFAMDPKLFAKKNYGKEAVKKFPRKAFAANGMEPDVVAELLGYPSSDEMVYDFVQALPIKEAAKAEAQLELTKRFGEDFTSSETFDLAVRAAFAEEGRTTILAKEFVALSKKAGRWVGERSPQQLAEQIAKNNTYGKKFKDINPKVTQAAARRAAVMAEREMVNGNWAAAADWKRKQLLAQAIDNEVQHVTRVVEKIRVKAVRYTQRPSKSVSPAAMEQLRDLVTRYDFAKITGKKLQKRIDLRGFLEQAEAVGLVTTVPEYLQNEAARISYKELTVEELLGFGDALDNLEHLGRIEQKVRIAGKQIEFAAVKDETLGVLRQRPSRERKERHYGVEHRTIADTLSDWTASWLKPEQIIEWLDIGDISGPMMRYVFQPIVDAQNEQNELNLKYNKKLIDIFQEFDPGYLTEKVHIRSLNRSMTREQIFVAALNTGNDSNRTKLLEGELWTDMHLQDVLSHMSAKDWAAAQRVWDIFEPLWDKIAALEKKLSGVAPPKIAAKEFTNQHGTFRGGYYPVVYDFKSRRGRNLIEDPTPANRSIEGDLFDNKFIKPGTNHKHTVKRTGATKTMLLELSALPAHVHRVIHDLTYREAVRGAYKLLWDADIKQVIIDVESEEIYGQLQHWLKSVATEQAVESDPNVRFLQHIRTGATIYGMGYRLTTILAQPLGFFNSLVRVSHKGLARGVYQMSRHPLKTLEVVNALSGEMKSRFNSQDRDIRDTANRLTEKPSKLNKIKIFSFYGIGYVDKWVATATWVGAYHDYLAQHPADHDKAVMHADRTVRLTQGTGNVKDMAKMQNNGEVLKLFTMFYSAFSAIWNMQVDLTRKTKNDINEGNWNNLFTERLPQWMYLVLMPSVAGALLAGQGPEEDESVSGWLLRTVLLYPTAGMPFVRDVVGAATFASGKTYKLSPAGKALDSSAKALGRVLNGDFTGAIKPAMETTAILTHLPVGQLMNSVEGLWGGLANGDFEPQDLIYGRRGK